MNSALVAAVPTKEDRVQASGTGTGTGTFTDRIQGQA
jgi:hypothetical protein